eukprot:TRINITY_DN15817_c0_g1_i1.p1 TRINITY_DN15817_c0_g1~~TRINITY_DN15817_c0_g1_i1.p1  ORF type:complete len:545 (+),score=92.64 TRINITY_DN15817_c0_g1_i1:225-1859(+)
MPGIPRELQPDDMEWDSDRLPKFFEAAAELSDFPGELSSQTIQHFLSSYPIQLIFRLLEEHGGEPGVEAVAVAVLGKIFDSSSSEALMPEALSYAQRGLQAPSTSVRRLACKAVLKLLGMSPDDMDSAVETFKLLNVVEPLLALLSDSDTGIASMATEGIQLLASSPSGLEVLVPSGAPKSGWLATASASSSSMTRVRAISLATHIASQSGQSADAVISAGVPESLRRELLQADVDMLTAVSVLELMKELAASPHGRRLVVAADAVPLLSNLITSPSTSPMVRSAALGTIPGLITSGGDPSSASDGGSLLQAVDEMLSLAGSPNDMDAAGEEHVSAIEALGQISTTRKGAELLLLGQPQPPARHLTGLAFETRRSSPANWAAVHALAQLAGAQRAPSDMLLSPAAETSLRDHCYSAAQASPSRPTLGGAVLARLQQTEETRVAAYRLIIALVARPWGARELCASEGIVTQVTDPQSERNRTAMEWRHSCCVAMWSAVLAAMSRGEDNVRQDLRTKLDEAAKRGPFLTGRARVEAIPLVATAQRM